MAGVDFLVAVRLAVAFLAGVAVGDVVEPVVAGAPGSVGSTTPVELAGVSGVVGGRGSSVLSATASSGEAPPGSDVGGVVAVVPVAVPGASAGFAAGAAI